jgi:hypothetical protein
MAVGCQSLDYLRATQPRHRHTPCPQGFLVLFGAATNDLVAEECIRLTFAGQPCTDPAILFL